MGVWDMIRMSKIFLAALVCVIAPGCGGHQRVLSVKTDPAEAEVCIKGKHKSQYFSSAKSCIGQTPFEADSVEVTTPKGEKEVVKFKDVDGDRETFYLVVSKPGYATQSLPVPSWDHFIALKPEGNSANNINVNLVRGSEGSGEVAKADKGSVKILSSPAGALVYINDVLKGNTPYTYDAAAGTTVRFKLESNGFKSVEKSVTVDSGKTIDLNVALVKQGGEPGRAVASEPKAKPQDEKEADSKSDSEEKEE